MKLTKLAIPHVEKNGRGAIINIASVAGRITMGGSAPYCASKFGVVGKLYRKQFLLWEVFVTKNFKI